MILLQNWSLPICVSWDFSAANGTSYFFTFTFTHCNNNFHLYTGLGNWSDSGCTLASHDIDTGKVQCNCSHLTNFAILVVSSWGS